MRMLMSMSERRFAVCDVNVDPVSDQAKLEFRKQVQGSRRARPAILCIIEANIFGGREPAVGVMQNVVHISSETLQRLIFGTPAFLFNAESRVSRPLVSNSRLQPASLAKHTQ